MQGADIGEATCSTHLHFCMMHSYICCNITWRRGINNVRMCRSMKVDCCCAALEGVRKQTLRRANAAANLGLTAEETKWKKKVLPAAGHIYSKHDEQRSSSPGPKTKRERKSQLEPLQSVDSNNEVSLALPKGMVLQEIYMAVYLVVILINCL